MSILLNLKFYDVSGAGTVSIVRYKTSKDPSQLSVLDRPALHHVCLMTEADIASRTSYNFIFSKTVSSVRHKFIINNRPLSQTYTGSCFYCSG